MIFTGIDDLIRINSSDVCQREERLVMAPTRKSRSVNKQFSNHSEVSPDKNNGNPIKSRQRVSMALFTWILCSHWTPNSVIGVFHAF